MALDYVILVKTPALCKCTIELQICVFLANTKFVSIKPNGLHLRLDEVRGLDLDR